MPNLLYNNAKLKIFNQSLNLVSPSTGTVKIMLIATSPSYTPNADHQFVAAGGANDPDDCEANVTNYTRGYGGSGRKTLAGKAIAVDNANDRAEFDANDVVWTALGGATNQTIAGAIIILEDGGSDSTALLIGWIDFTDFLTNGADLTLAWDPEGIIQLASFPGCLQLLPSALKKLWSALSERLSRPAVEKLQRLGIKPHIYRSAAPLSFKAR